jgi:hypothetical protein
MHSSAGLQWRKRWRSALRPVPDYLGSLDGRLGDYTRARDRLAPRLLLESVSDRLSLGLLLSVAPKWGFIRSSAGCTAGGSFAPNASPRLPRSGSFGVAARAGSGDVMRLPTSQFVSMLVMRDHPRAGCRRVVNVTL